MQNLDLTGLLNSIILSAIDIDEGRRFLATDGLEHDGRLVYENGISIALETFQIAQATVDPQTLMTW